MTFEKALTTLGIEDFRERIFNSSSTGELHFLADYISMGNILAGDEVGIGLFSRFFHQAVTTAEKEWERPESAFQHIPNEFIAWATKAGQK